MLFTFNCKIRAILPDKQKNFLCMPIALLKLLKKTQITYTHFGYFNWKSLFLFNDTITADLYSLILYSALTEFI